MAPGYASDRQLLLATRRVPGLAGPAAPAPDVHQHAHGQPEIVGGSPPGGYYLGANGLSSQREAYQPYRMS